MKLLFIFSAIFLCVKAQEVKDPNLDDNYVLDTDDRFLISDEDDYEADDYEFDDDEEISDFDLVADEGDNDDDDEYEYEDDVYGDVSDYDFVDNER
ncbi:unnamed protein product [Oikopleura dioica]|uniref:Uncharacterized protein n=1 Tax=Oikopleura dioica TaxID=34765 RepID=E4XWB6_OIKDI|nr:unnamed protein product [Oikopleura dioica]